MSLTAAADVGVVEHDDRIYVARLPEGPILVLTGEAAAVWRAATAGVQPAPDIDDENVRALLAARLLTLRKDA